MRAATVKGKYAKDAIAEESASDVVASSNHARLVRIIVHSSLLVGTSLRIAVGCRRVMVTHLGFSSKGGHVLVTRGIVHHSLLMCAGLLHAVGCG